jgi:hypothetical protein
LNAFIKIVLPVIILGILVIPAFLSGFENIVVLPDWFYEIPENDSSLYTIDWISKSNKYSSSSSCAGVIESLCHETDCLVIKKEYWSNRSLAEPDSVIWAVSIRSHRINAASCEVVERNPYSAESDLALSKTCLNEVASQKDEIEYIYIKKTGCKSGNGQEEWLFSRHYNLDQIFSFEASSPKDPPSEYYYTHEYEPINYPDWFLATENNSENLKCSSSNITGWYELSTAYKKALCEGAGALCQNFNSDVKQYEHLTDTVYWCSFQEIRIKKLAIADKPDHQELLMQLCGKYDGLPEPEPHFFDKEVSLLEKAERRIFDNWRSTYNRMNKTISNIK